MGQDYYFSSGVVGAPPAFRFQVTTAGADTFQLPLVVGGTYNFDIDWGDGNSDTITVWNDAAANHSYTGAGTYNCVVTGTIHGWSFAQIPADKGLFVSISEWGPLSILEIQAFKDCTALATISATDSPYFNSTPLMQGAFQGCTALVSININNWSFPNTIDLQSLFENCTSLTTITADSLDTTNNTKLLSMIAGCSALTTFDPSGWNIESVTAMNNFMNGAGNLSTAVYDALLVAWEAQTEPLSMTVHFSGSTYTGASAAATARAVLVGTSSWTITDGGAI